MKEFKVDDRVIACYASDITGKPKEIGGTIIDVTWFILGNVGARAFAVKMDDGLIDTFSEGSLSDEPSS